MGGPIALGAFVLGNILPTLGLPKPNFAFARKSPSRVESSLSPNKLDRDRHRPPNFVG